MVAADQCIAQGRHGGALFGYRRREPFGAPVVGREGEANDAIRLRGSGPKHVQVFKPAPEHLGAGALQRVRRAIRAGQRQHAVAMVEKFSDHRRADRARSPGDENTHTIPPQP